MSLKTIPSSELVNKTKSLIAEERRITAEILWHIREIESRWLFSEMGYGSMFEMLTQYFGYSEGCAYRRLSAARLLKDIPELETSIKDGSLSLTTASLAQRFFNQEKKAGKPYSIQAKAEVLKTISGKSRLEVEREFASRAPELAKPEQVRVMNLDESELRITLSEAQLEKLKKLKLLLSHKSPNMSFSKLIGHLADQELKRLDLSTSPGEVRINKPVKNPESRYIPRPLKRQIWQRAEGCCEYIDPKTARRCGSRFQLQVDHIILVSQGGLTEEKNLRLLCRNHNIHSALKTLGPQLMSRYLKTG